MTAAETRTSLNVDEVVDQHPLLITRQIAFWLNDIWHGVFPRLASEPEGSIDWRPCVLVAFLPVALDICLRMVSTGSSWRATAWMSIAATLLTVLLVSAPWGWDSVKDLAGRIDAMLDVDTDQSEASADAQADRDEYVATVAERLPLRRSHYVVCRSDRSGRSSRPTSHPSNFPVSLSGRRTT